MNLTCRTAPSAPALASAIEQRDGDAVGENAALTAEHLDAAGDPRPLGTCVPVRVSAVIGAARSS